MTDTFISATQMSSAIGELFIFEIEYGRRLFQTSKENFVNCGLQQTRLVANRFGAFLSIFISRKGKKKKAEKCHTFQWIKSRRWMTLKRKSSVVCIAQVSGSCDS